MAEQQQGPGFWATLGEGLRGAGAVLSPEVYKSQQDERQHTLINVARSLEIRKAQRALDADSKFSAAVGGLQPSAFKTSAELLDALKEVPLDVIAESPRAQQTMAMAGQMQAREAAQAAKVQQMDFQYAQLEQRGEIARQRSEDNRLSAEERARANLANEQIRSKLAELRETIAAGKGEGKLTGDAVTNEAWYQIINGKIRPGAVSWGVSGNADRVAITNKMAEIASEYGIPPDKLASLGLTNRAKASALLALEKQRNAVQAYERSFVSQIDVLEGLSQKVGRTDSPWVNKSLNELRSKGMGDPDVAEYLGQMRLVQTEAARIIANPNLSGQLTDTARKEIHDILNGEMTVAQVTRLTTRLKADAELRKQGLDKQAEQLGNEIRGSAEAPKAEAPKAATPAAAAAPKQGDKDKSRSGKPMTYDGTKWVYD